MARPKDVPKGMDKKVKQQAVINKESKKIEKILKDKDKK